MGCTAHYLEQKSSLETAYLGPQYSEKKQIENSIFILRVSYVVADG
jgi:hypothetical protein